MGNTDSRREELIKFLDAVLKTGKLKKAEALKLRGRLQFASGNVFGRIAKSILSAVTAHAYYCKSQELDDRTVLALNPSQAITSRWSTTRIEAYNWQSLFCADGCML